MCVVQTEAVPAVEWQVWCNSPASQGRCTARALLQHLLVNPPSLTPHLPQLEPVPLTLTLQVKDIRLHLVVEAGDAGYTLGTAAVAESEQQQVLGVVYLTSLQVERICFQPSWKKVLDSSILLDD